MWLRKLASRVTRARPSHAEVDVTTGSVTDIVARVRHRYGSDSDVVALCGILECALAALGEQYAGQVTAPVTSPQAAPAPARVTVTSPPVRRSGDEHVTLAPRVTARPLTGAERMRRYREKQLLKQASPNGEGPR